jgi:hypothetical protein
VWFPVCIITSHLERIGGLGGTHQRHQCYNSKGSRQQNQPLGASQALPRGAVGGGAAGVELPRLDGAAKGLGEGRSAAGRIVS